MNVLFFSAAMTGIAPRLFQEVTSQVTEGQIVICRSLAALDERLRKPLDGLTVAVLHAASGEELEALIARRELLADLKIILALPDDQGETTARGHLLRPRYCVFSEVDLPDANAILGKIQKGPQGAGPSEKLGA